MRETFLGCPINILSMAETVDRASDAMRSRKRLLHADKLWKEMERRRLQVRPMDWS